MRWLGYFFIFMGIKMATDGVLRGLGIMRPFLIANMVNLAIRLSVALIFAPRFGIAFVWLAVPAVAAAANGTARIYCNKNFQRGGEKAGAAAVESISENIYSRKAKRRESL